MSEQFESLSVIELRQKAKEMGVKLGAGINKKGIVEKLKEAAGQMEAAAPAPAPVPEEPAPQPEAAPAPEPPARPIRSAAIIADDEETDDEDVSMLTASRAPRPVPRAPVRPASPPPTGAAAPAGSSLSTISAKAPAFTMEGSRAWHNPRAYQAPGGYQRSAAPASWNSRAPQQGGQDQRSYSRPAQRPAPQPTYVNRFGPDQPAQEPEPAYRGYNAPPPQQDYAPRREAPANPGFGYSQPAFPANREQQNPAAALSEILAAGECGDGEGVLEVHPDGYGFLRTHHYLPGKQDVYISNAQIRRFALRNGDYIVGKTRPQREAERYSAMLYITEINGAVPDEMPTRARFEDFTPIYPKKKISLLQKKESDPALRLMDLVSPIGFGQRAMLLCTPRVDRLALLKKLAAAIAKNHSKAQLLLLLVDERPEEVTLVQESVKGEVIFSNFDEPADNQAKVAEMALERALRLVEQKKDVIFLTDSLTHLSRACNATMPLSSRATGSSLANGALIRPKKFFGAARNTREGGSLTVIATMLTQTGSDLDTAILQEFQGTSNMTCALDQAPDGQLLVDMASAHTIHDEWLLTESELALANQLREQTRNMTPAQAMAALMPALKNGDTPEALSAALNGTQPEGEQISMEQTGESED